MTWEQREKQLVQDLAKFYAQQVKDPAWRDYVRDRMASMNWPEVKAAANALRSLSPSHSPIQTLAPTAPRDGTGRPPHD